VSLHSRKEFERNCKKASILQRRVRERWEHEWKVLIFVAIRDEALVRSFIPMITDVRL